MKSNLPKFRSGGLKVHDGYHIHSDHIDILLVTLGVNAEINVVFGELSENQIAEIKIFNNSLDSRL